LKRTWTTITACVLILSLILAGCSKGGKNANPDNSGIDTTNASGESNPQVTISVFAQQGTDTN